MDKVYETTDKIFQDCILKLRIDCSEIETQHFKTLNEKENKISDLIKINDKLISDLSEKDKMLLQRDRTIYDYSMQIEILSKQKVEEETSANKVSMIKAKDKAVSDLTRDNNILKEKNKSLENQIKELKDMKVNIEEVIEEDPVEQRENPAEQEVETHIEQEVEDEKEEVKEVKDEKEEVKNKKEEKVERQDEKEEVKEEEGEEEEEEEDEEEDNPYVIFQYNGKDYGFDSAGKVEHYYEIDEENNTLGEIINTLKFTKPKSLDKRPVFVLQDGKKKYILDCLEGYIPGGVIGYKKSNDYILNE